MGIFDYIEPIDKKLYTLCSKAEEHKGDDTDIFLLKCCRVIEYLSDMCCTEGLNVKIDDNIKDRIFSLKDNCSLDALFDYDYAIEVDTKAIFDDLNSLCKMWVASDTARAIYYGRGDDAYNRKDYARALSYYASAGHLGETKAQVKLGQMYDKGVGTERSSQASFYWYKMAAENGDMESQYEVGSHYSMGYGVEENKKEAA